MLISAITTRLPLRHPSVGRWLPAASLLLLVISLSAGPLLLHARSNRNSGRRGGNQQPHPHFPPIFQPVLYAPVYPPMAAFPAVPFIPVGPTRRPQQPWQQQPKDGRSRSRKNRRDRNQQNRAKQTHPNGIHPPPPPVPHKSMQPSQIEQDRSHPEAPFPAPNQIPELSNHGTPENNQNHQYPQVNPQDRIMAPSSPASQFDRTPEVSQTFQTPQVHQSPHVTQNIQGPQVHQNPHVTQNIQGPQVHQNPHVTQNIQGPQVHQNPHVTQNIQGPQVYQNPQIIQNIQGSQIHQNPHISQNIQAPEFNQIRGPIVQNSNLPSTHQDEPLSPQNNQAHLANQHQNSRVPTDPQALQTPQQNYVAPQDFEHGDNDSIRDTNNPKNLFPEINKIASIISKPQSLDKETVDKLRALVADGQQKLDEISRMLDSFNPNSQRTTNESHPSGDGENVVLMDPKGSEDKADMDLNDNKIVNHHDSPDHNDDAHSISVDHREPGQSINSLPLDNNHPEEMNHANGHENSLDGDIENLSNPEDHLPITQIPPIESLEEHPHEPIEDHHSFGSENHPENIDPNSHIDRDDDRKLNPMEAPHLSTDIVDEVHPIGDVNHPVPASDAIPESIGHSSQDKIHNGSGSPTEEVHDGASEGPIDHPGDVEVEMVPHDPEIASVESLEDPLDPNIDRHGSGSENHPVHIDHNPHLDHDDDRKLNPMEAPHPSTDIVNDVLPIGDVIHPVPAHDVNHLVQASDATPESTGHNSRDKIHDGSGSPTEEMHDGATEGPINHPGDAEVEMVPHGPEIASIKPLGEPQAPIVNQNGVGSENHPDHIDHNLHLDHDDDDRRDPMKSTHPSMDIVDDVHLIGDVNHQVPASDVNHQVPASDGIPESIGHNPHDKIHDDSGSQTEEVNDSASDGPINHPGDTEVEIVPHGPQIASIESLGDPHEPIVDHHSIGSENHPVHIDHNPHLDHDDDRKLNPMGAPHPSTDIVDDVLPIGDVNHPVPARDAIPESIGHNPHDKIHDSSGSPNEEMHEGATEGPINHPGDAEVEMVPHVDPLDLSVENTNLRHDLDDNHHEHHPHSGSNKPEGTILPSDSVNSLNGGPKIDPDRDGYLSHTNEHPPEGILDGPNEPVASEKSMNGPINDDDNDNVHGAPRVGENNGLDSSIHGPDDEPSMSTDNLIHNPPHKSTETAINPDDHVPGATMIPTSGVDSDNHAGEEVAELSHPLSIPTDSKTIGGEHPSVPTLPLSGDRRSNIPAGAMKLIAQLPEVAKPLLQSLTPGPEFDKNSAQNLETLPNQLDSETLAESLEPMGADQERDINPPRAQSNSPTSEEHQHLNDGLPIRPASAGNTLGDFHDSADAHTPSSSLKTMLDPTSSQSSISDIPPTYSTNMAPEAMVPARGGAFDGPQNQYDPSGLPFTQAPGNLRKLSVASATASASASASGRPNGRPVNNGPPQIALNNLRAAGSHENYHPTGVHQPSPGRPMKDGLNLNHHDDQLSYPKERFPQPSGHERNSGYDSDEDDDDDDDDNYVAQGFDDDLMDDWVGGSGSVMGSNGGLSKRRRVVRKVKRVARRGFDKVGQGANKLRNHRLANAVIEKSRHHAGPLVQAGIHQTRDGLSLIRSGLRDREMDGGGNYLELSRVVPDRLGNYPIVPKVPQAAGGGSRRVAGRRHRLLPTRKRKRF